MNNVKQLIQQRHEEFLRSRLEIEAWVTRLFKQIEGFDLSSIENKPAGKTAKEIFPSLYAEEFSLAQFDIELNTFMLWYSKVKEYGDAVNRKAADSLARIAR